MVANGTGSGTHDGTSGGTPGGTPDGTRRFPVTEAAAVLGISTEATRQRIKRGTLPTERDEDGTVFVLLDVDGTGGGTRSYSDGTGGGTADSTVLIAAKDETIQALKEQLAAWQEESRRKDHIIAALTERIPELEAAPEAREAPETASEEPGGPQPPEQQRRSWWRAFFGLE
jgi:uncharacterized coiled-coil protein SlyX